MIELLKSTVNTVYYVVHTTVRGVACLCIATVDFVARELGFRSRYR